MWVRAQGNVSSLLSLAEVSVNGAVGYIENHRAPSERSPCNQSAKRGTGMEEESKSGETQDSSEKEMKIINK